MKRKRRIEKVKEEQPYKVGKPFVKWLDSQINCYRASMLGGSRWEKLEDEIMQEAYIFIKSVIKP